MVNFILALRSTRSRSAAPKFKIVGVNALVIVAACGGQGFDRVLGGSVCKCQGVFGLKENLSF